ncbi:glycosyltransferase family 2 protein [Thalassobellus suaedae]|uniref:Glycosyltransferase n=1 Tax=Thalassobellus suaedae TaxID=3074124 RepID=A0ABY9Y2Y2_9FLAO|nr:glycosyltransferase [Flavobacteriaceae bacterium HL-DH10]
MLLSIIIPVYNAERFLEKCVNSIIKAKKKIKIEIILINDGSKDNSFNICQNYANNFDFIKVINQINSGPSAARNKGIDIAKGNYLTFVDADDFVEENYFESITKNIEKYRVVDIIIYGYYKVYEKEKKINYSYFKFDKILEHNTILKLMENTFDYDYLLFPVNKVYKRKFFDSGIRFDKTLRLGEDAIFNLEIFYEANTIVFVKEALYNYYENLESATSQKFKPNLYKAMSSHFERKITFYKSKDDLNQKVYFNDIARVNLAKTLFAFVSNILANKDLNFEEELKKIRKFELIKFGFKHIKIKEIKRLKHIVVILLFKYNQYKLLQLIYKR